MKKALYANSATYQLLDLAVSCEPVVAHRPQRAHNRGKNHGQEVTLGAVWLEVLQLSIRFVNGPPSAGRTTRDDECEFFVVDSDRLAQSFELADLLRRWTEVWRKFGNPCRGRPQEV